jgi:hypothetical protein
VPNMKEYSTNIIPHSIPIQHKTQNTNNGIMMIPLNPEQIISSGTYQNAGTGIISGDKKFIYFNYNMLQFSADFIKSRLTFGVRYSMLDFIRLTGAHAGISQNGVKIKLSKTFITFQSPLNIVIEITDSSPTNLGYRLIILKNIKTVTSYINHAAVNLQYNATDLTRRVFFIDGLLKYMPFTVDNGIATYKFDGTGKEVEEYYITSIFINTKMTTITINGKNCLEFEVDTYISPRLIMYMKDGDTIFNTSPNYITHRHFEVPSAGTYYVLLAHKSNIGELVDNPIAKFEKIIGRVNDYQSEVPTSFYSYLDDLREPSLLGVGEATTETAKAFKYFPDLFKNTISANDNIPMLSIVATDHTPYLNNHFLYPTEPSKQQTFSVECRYFQFNVGSGAPMIFVDGLLASPAYRYVKNSISHVFYPRSQVDNKRMCVWHIAESFQETGSYTVTVPASKEVRVGPNRRLGDIYKEFAVVEEDWNTHVVSTVIGWTVSFEDSFATFKFTDAHIGKTFKIYHLDCGYVQYYPKAKTMAFELPWYLMHNTNLFVFVDGRIAKHYAIIPPVTMRTIKAVPMGLNIASDSINGEDVYIVSTPDLTLYEQRTTLNPTDGIIELTNKEIPFSKDYMVIFINGKFIHPEDICEISSYKFGLYGVQSINDLRIYIKRSVLGGKYKAYSDIFKSCVKDWDTYINGKTYAQLKSLVGATDIMNTDPQYDISSDPKQFWYEILYKFFMTESTQSMLDTDVDQLLIDFEPIITNGRIVLESNRGGQEARFKY